MIISVVYDLSEDSSILVVIFPNNQAFNLLKEIYTPDLPIEEAF